MQSHNQTEALLSLAETEEGGSTTPRHNHVSIFKKQAPHRHSGQQPPLTGPKALMSEQATQDAGAATNSAVQAHRSGIGLW
jgi:hypothetical protein